ncbi:penicillin acylase family protein [Micromonospora sp. H33]|uniref:penicillin acylase family protein n=1 Tax=Micromonospora sp. H33 TaxID=3452215 RepID=UPI003F8BF578
MCAGTLPRRGHRGTRRLAADGGVGGRGSCPAAKITYPGVEGTRIPRRESRTHFLATGAEVDAVPSMRMIVDLADLDASRWIQLTGNSGHAFHSNYDDQLELWRTGQTLPMRWDRTAIAAEAAQTLTLEP